jgi:hypothetical protein
VSAYGQAVLSLGSNPTRVRSEGITEVVGLITLTNATNQNQVIKGGTTLSVVFDGNITNDPGIATTAIGAVTGPDRNIYTQGAGSSQQDGAGGIAQYVGAGACTTVPTGATCLGLVVSRSGPTLTISVPSTFFNTAAACGVATHVAAPNGVDEFCLVPGGSLNIQGVRVNVSGLSGNIFATITPTPANALTFPSGNNATIVGRAQATIGSVTVAKTASLGQCAFTTTPSTLPSTTFVPVTSGDTAWVNVAEPSNFQTAFNAANSNSPAAPSSWDEAGITPGGIGTSTTTGATAATLGFQGTAQPVTKGVQIVLSLAGIPTGVVLLVPNAITGTGGSVSSTTGLAQAGTITVQLVTSTGLATGATTYSAITPSSGAATVAYEVTATGSTAPTTVDTLSISISFTAASTAIIQVGSLGTVQASVGAVTGSASFSTSSTSGVTLRFAANSGVPATPLALGAVNSCLTNLLFPFVSNRAGTTFNTGLAISNAALDSGTTKGEFGGVTLYFYGISAPTGGSAGILMPIPSVSAGGTVATSGVIAPGEHTVLALNDGTATAIAAGFQGYIVALCNFRYAHGLATVFDNFGVGAANVGFSYLPIVISGTLPVPRSGTNNALGTLGESKAH